MGSIYLSASAMQHGYSMQCLGEDDLRRRLLPVSVAVACGILNGFTATMVSSANKISTLAAVSSQIQLNCPLQFDGGDNGRRKFKGFVFQ
jgi:tetrahydromethanopterin S-methyltransferase subunit C